MSNTLNADPRVLSAAGLKSEFFDSFEKFTPLFPDVTTRIVSNKDKETYAFLGSVPPMRPWGRGRLARGLFVESYDIENEKYESTIEVDRDEIDDDQTGQIRLRIREMAERAATHKDLLLAELLVNGHSAGYHSYDGVPFFNTNHESGNSGVQSNIVDVNITTPADYTVSDLRVALKQGIARLLSLKDDQGEPMNTDATGLVAVVPPSMYIDALEALNAQIIANTSNVMQAAAQVRAFARLTTATEFYLLKTNVTVRPFIFQDRAPVEFKAREEDSEKGFTQEVFQYGVRARYNLTYGYWQRGLKISFV